MRRLVLALAVAACVVGPAAAAAAHPLGNFTANTAAALVVTPEAIEVGYVVDLAEIPALQVIQELDGDEDGYRRRECAALAGGITLMVGGERLASRVAASALTFPPGQAGLATLRLECTLVADIDGWMRGERTVAFADANLQGRTGWREVTAVGDGVTLLDSDVPAVSPTDQLRSYPPERLASPLDVTGATLLARPGGAGAADRSGGAAPVRAVDGLAVTDRFTGLVGARDLTLAVGLVAVAVALGLGALHALAPGHGKTVMAAYLLSRDARTRQIAALALTVATAHTLGVLILGAVVGLTEIVAPQRLYAWLGVASGLLFAIVGVTLLRQARRARGHHHHHDHRPGWRGLIAPGLAGGLVPTPSALVVLLGGIALNRTWFGILLVVAYGCGMGCTLVAAGWALSRARDRLAARATSTRLAPLLTALPTLTASLLVITGLALAARAAVAL